MAGKLQHKADTIVCNFEASISPCELMWLLFLPLPTCGRGSAWKGKLRSSARCHEQSVRQQEILRHESKYTKLAFLTVWQTRSDPISRQSRVSYQKLPPLPLCWFLNEKICHIKPGPLEQQLLPTVQGQKEFWIKCIAWQIWMWVKSTVWTYPLLKVLALILNGGGANGGSVICSLLLPSLVKSLLELFGLLL